MKRVLLLLPPGRYLSPALALGCACSALLASLGTAAQQKTDTVRDRDALLLVADVTADRPSTDLVSRVRLFVADDRLTLRALSPDDVSRAIGLSAGGGRLPVPDLLEVSVPAAIDADVIARRLARHPGLTVQRLTSPHPPRASFLPGGWALLLLALANAGWAAHRLVRRRAPLLQLLRRIGCPPDRLASEALAPVAASAAAGAVVGDALAWLLPIGSPGPALPLWLLVPPPLILAAALICSLGSLRRLIAGLP